MKNILFNIKVGVDIRNVTKKLLGSFKRRKRIVYLCLAWGLWMMMVLVKRLLPAPAAAVTVTAGWRLGRVCWLRRDCFGRGEYRLLLAQTHDIG